MTAPVSFCRLFGHCNLRCPFFRFLRRRVQESLDRGPHLPLRVCAVVGHIQIRRGPQRLAGEGHPLSGDRRVKHVTPEPDADERNPRPLGLGLRKPQQIEHP